MATLDPSMETIIVIELIYKKNWYIVTIKID